MTFSAGAAIYAKDILRVSRFYEQVTGLAISHEESGYIVLGSNAFQLVVVSIPPHIAGQIHIASPPERREDSAIKLVFIVPSIASARAVASELGGVIDGADREWKFQNAVVCDGHDPEGNVLQLRESAL
jgi:predicted enzyme related to lactoylglutathione lyase